MKVRIDGEVYLNAGEGNGPVNALDVALRKDLGKYQRHIADLELVDYKVRILNGGTGATTRVLIESRDGKGNRWFTVGRLAQYRRGLVPGALRFDHLQAGARRGVADELPLPPSRGRWRRRRMRGAAQVRSSTMHRPLIALRHPPRGEGL